MQLRWNALMRSVHNWNGISYVQEDESVPDGYHEHLLPEQRSPPLPESWFLLLSVLSPPFLQYEPDEYDHPQSVFQEQFLPLHGGLDQILIKQRPPVYRQ